MAREPMVTFTVRVPQNLANQIDARAKILERSRNYIVSDLLMKAIDESVRNDLETLRTTAGRTAMTP